MSSLFVQLVTVGDDGHARVGVVLQNPRASSTIMMLLPLPWVCQMMPLWRRWTCACAALLPKYGDTRQLLHAAVEQHKVVHQLDQPIFTAHLEQVLVQFEAAVVRLILLSR